MLVTFHISHGLGDLPSQAHSIRAAPHDASTFEAPLPGVVRSCLKKGSLFGANGLEEKHLGNRPVSLAVGMV